MAHQRLVAMGCALAALLGLGSPLAAQDHHDHQDAASSTPAPMRRLVWSDPASWPDGRVPQAGSEQGRNEIGQAMAAR